MSAISYIRSWADAQKEEYQNSSKITPDIVFAYIIYGLANFGRDDPSREKISDVNFCETYGNDVALFELGCYLYVQLDVWFFTHKPHLRKQFAQMFILNYYKLFSEALKIKNIPELFTERAEKYGELERSVETQDYHFHLRQLILRSENNTLPQKYNFGNETTSVSAICEAVVSVELMAWEKFDLPKIIAILKQF